MGARISVDHLASGELHIALRQDEPEVIRFALFVALIVGALYALTPATRTSPGWLLALLVLASAWSAIALTAREVYTIDATAGRDHRDAHVAPWEPHRHCQRRRDRGGEAGH